MNDPTKLLAEANALVMQIPGAADIIAATQKGDHTPMEAAALLAGLLERNKKQASALNELIRVEGQAAPLVMEHDNGASMLNPLVEAAIIERSSIDGDVPECRSGPLPDGAFPAVPVKTVSPDPVLVGVMLQRASEQVQGELKLAFQEHKAICATKQATIKALIDCGDDDEKVTALLEKAKKDLPAPPTGVGGYEAGALPALREVPEPSPIELAVLTEEARQKAAYLAVATTQGRRSLRPVVEELVRQELADHGVSVEVGEVVDPTLQAVWVVEVHGPDEISDEFSPAKTAAITLAQDLVGGGAADMVSPVLTVKAINAIADRQFGWGALLKPKEEV